MDVKVGAGRDSTWRRAPTAAAAADGGGDDADARGGGVGGGMEAQVVPLELYDSARAKIEANLRWLFAKAYGTGKVETVFVFACLPACFVQVTHHMSFICPYFNCFSCLS